MRRRDDRFREVLRTYLNRRAIRWSEWAILLTLISPLLLANANMGLTRAVGWSTEQQILSERVHSAASWKPDRWSMGQALAVPLYHEDGLFRLWSMYAFMTLF